MMLMARRLSVLAAVIFWAAAILAQDLSSIGPAIGARVPAISGIDQFGRQQTLESLTGPAGVMLVFFRSADW
jgi:hypothetical protein